jgi:hypothetical protein
MTEDQIKHMVSRFLGWRLPVNFRPDAGISFKAEFNEHTAHPMKHEPTGTNLFDAAQAEAMVRHMLEGLHLLSEKTQRPKEESGWLIETGDHKYWNGRHANQGAFTHDPNDAVRFARFEDGERIVHWLMKDYSVFLATRQHAWADGDA